MKSRITNTTVFLIVLAVGTVLRFWDFASIPFSHDEFSALFRTKYTSFYELINQGVLPDGHPAGVQVFLWLWTSMFGTHEWVVKLPFALVGVASIALFYKVAKLWYNKTVAIVSATFLACLQYPIVYSVTARPYISGLFLGLLMVWFWSQLVRHPEVKFWKHGILFTIFAALCAYNHHFSLLFAAIVGFSGLVFLPYKYWFKYVSLGVLIFALYVPHLGILFDQLDRGGVEGWLAKPESDFLWTYIRYIFHYSWWLVGLIVLIVIVGWVLCRAAVKRKQTILFALWFLLPFGIGYWYSRNVNAVLQYSVLIFSFPYLFFLLFGHIKEQKPLANLVLVSVISITCIFTLALERQHFTLLYNSHYEHIVVDSKGNEGLPKTLNIVDSHKKITQYYKDKNDMQQTLVWCDSFTSEIDFREYVKAQTKRNSSIYFGAWSKTNPNYYSIMKEYFPREERIGNYVGGATSLFFADGKRADIELSRNSFSEEESIGWPPIDNSRVDSGYYMLDSMSEWSSAYEQKLSDVLTHRNNQIAVSVNVKPIKGVNDVSIVTVIQDGDKIQHWSNVQFSRFVADSTSDWTTVHQVTNLADIKLTRNSMLKTFVWNKDRGVYLLDDFIIRLVQGNPVVYGLRDEF